MSEGRNGIIFAGNLIVDTVKFIDEWPKEMGLSPITAQGSALGGLACNCATDMAKLAPEVPLKVIGIVGNDSLGDYVFQRFSEHPSIDTSSIIREGETSYTDVITTPNGQRTFFQFAGANKMLGSEHFDFSGSDAAILHIGYVFLLDKLDGPDPEYATGLCRVLDMASKAGILTSIDFISEFGDRYVTIAKPALAYTDILSINDIESEGLTGIKLRDENGSLIRENLEPCARMIASFGVRKWACVHMPEIAVGIDIESGAYIEKEPPDVPRSYIKSSVGAGDAFATGLLYGAYRGISLEKAIEEANAVATVSLAGVGASDSIRPLDDILLEMEKYIV